MKKLLLIYILILGIIITLGCIDEYTNSEVFADSQINNDSGIQTPISPEKEAKILFSENFETGIQNWSLEEGWNLERIGNNTVLKGKGHRWATLEKGGWDNFSFKSNFKLIQGSIHFNYRHNDMPNGLQRYFIGVCGDTLYLNKQSGDVFFDLTEVPLLLNNEWHEIMIKGYGDVINIYLDGNLKISYKDENPIINGSIAFETLEDSEFIIDDVKIEENLHSDIVTELKPLRISNTSKSGILTRDEIWSGEIFVIDHIIIPKGVTLTVEPGTKIKFKHYRGYKEPDKKLSLQVMGTLTAIGTPEQQIWFTSDAPYPINGDWHMIRFFDVSNESIIKYAIVEFAQQGINLWNSDITISNSIIRWNNWEGIYLESYSKPIIEYNRIYQNGYNGIAMEQFNDAIIRYNTISESGTHGIHIDASKATVEKNFVHDNSGSQLSVDDHGTLIANNNILSGEAPGFLCGEGENKVIAKQNKINTNIKVDCPENALIEFTEGMGFQLEYNYPDSKNFELGYTPGNIEKDCYMYVYPDKDETRKIINKIGEGLGLTWSITFDGEYIWTSTLWGDVYKLDPNTGEIKKHWKFPGPQAWGMTFDGENLWINDFAEKKVYELDTNGNVLSSFFIPDQEGGAKGLASDGQYLYIMGWTSPTIYKVNKKGDLIETIELEEWAAGGLTFDGQSFWVPCGHICKFNKEGKLLGRIYGASEGTWDLTWDGKYLWATQRTNENWQDSKIYKIEIIDDSQK